MFVGYACQPFFLTTLDDDVPLPLDCSSRAVGELWICGDQVGRGYLHQTNGGFVENYMGVVEKAYRTGDLVRLVDQHLEFLGRRDHQFKINGMRVDPQEIVSTIQKYCDIQQVHVSLINNQLVAFIASVVTIKNEEALKTVLAKRLPRYMVPTNIIQLDGDFPLNRNGKIDQQKLEECYALKMSSATRLPPNEALTENGKKLAAIWMQTINDLNLPSINLKANFFELGGHSLSVLKLQTRIKEELAVELTFDQLYRFSNFADQLALIEDQFDYKNEVVQVIRECQNANASVYCIHAIGGTIYPYFSMSTLWPSTCNVYAISYNIDYPANTLNQLAEFYYKQACIILKHAKNIKRPFLLLGHSLGGIISWLIAALCLKNNQPVPIVCAFDSWVVDNNKLDEAEVLNYLKSRFETLEGAEKLINAALKLCQMLKRYQMEYCSVALNLFKAERLGETALKHAIRKDLTEEMVNAKMDNGWMEYVEELSVYPCDCDHDSITEPKVLSQYVWLFEQLINQTISK
ncbi:Fatty acid synthase [Aphelenchoides bicaudatus]|nr:Fatty acid synthase [Aphelenchoides bicaudatus]